MAGDAVRDYLERRAARGPWRLELSRPGPFPGGIVIPALAEEDSLQLLLDSLSLDSSLSREGLVVLFVVNSREDATEDEKSDNGRSLQLLRSSFGALPFPVGVVDAASSGLCLPDKDGGVGLARKIGHDLLLSHLDFSGSDPVIISLDADTLVSPGYAGAILEHFRTSTLGGAVIPFVHLSAEGDLQNRAIERYELFLRCYVAGLAHAGSPYGFHTVGSAMACTASAYLKCGGMNRRRAGEDFYFLQSLAKTSGVGQVEGAMVFPSPRRSGRVPFGTGRAVGMLLDDGSEAVLFYCPDCYRILKSWLELALDGCSKRSVELLHRGGEVSPHLKDFLSDQGFSKAWEGFLRQNRSETQLVKAFHLWFDAFRTMKFFHYLVEKEYPRAEPEDVLDGFPAAWGEAGLSMKERLEFLRGVQN